MKRLNPKLVLLASAAALAFFAVGPVVRAADGKSKSGEGSPGKKHDDETLRRYDRNSNGKLDPDEEAAMKADQERAKNEGKKKKG
jgi:hypothetical protein